MLFNSLYYLVFLNAVFIGLCIISLRKYQHLFLLFASYFFFYVSSNIFIVLLYIASFSSYYFGIAIYKSEERTYKKICLATGCLLLIGILAYFKYYNFTVENLDYLFSALNIVPPFSSISILLPIGISFYTFEALIYLIDIYRGTIEPAESLRDYLLYMAFFPKLIAGPIVRAWEFLPQLKNKIEFTPKNVKYGITLIVWGLFKKVVIADNFGLFVNVRFDNPIAHSLTSFDVWIATLAFGIQIFCDFSAYTDIAIGTAIMMGIVLPENFNRPYFSSNPASFWRNWHMTLTRIIRDYIYIPLGGSRNGKIRTYLNIMFAWTLSGLWHGASVNFLIWGGYHGFLLILNKIIKGVKRGTGSLSLPTVFLCIIITQYFIFLGWLFFRLKNFDQIAYCVYRYVVPDLILTVPERYLVSLMMICVVIIWLLLHTDTVRTIAIKISGFNHIHYISNLNLQWWFVACGIIGLFIVMLGPDASPQFLYFQF